MFSMLHEGKSRDLMLLLVLVPCFLSQAWCESLRQRRTWPTRVYPGHVGFPDNETWVYFAQKLDGYVITPQNCTAYGEYNFYLSSQNVKEKERKKTV